MLPSEEEGLQVPEGEELTVEKRVACSRNWGSDRRMKISMHSLQGDTTADFVSWNQAQVHPLCGEATVQWGVAWWGSVIWIRTQWARRPGGRGERHGRGWEAHRGLLSHAESSRGWRPNCVCVMALIHRMASFSPAAPSSPPVRGGWLLTWT